MWPKNSFQRSYHFAEHLWSIVVQRIYFKSNNTWTKGNTRLREAMWSEDFPTSKQHDTFDPAFQAQPWHSLWCMEYLLSMPCSPFVCIAKAIVIRQKGEYRLKLFVWSTYNKIILGPNSTVGSNHDAEGTDVILTLGIQTIHHCLLQVQLQNRVDRKLS